jgi:amidase
MDLTRNEFGRLALATAATALAPVLSSARPTPASEESEIEREVAALGPQKDSEIVDMDGVALSIAIQRKRVSCREVMSAYLAQIGRLNPKFTAIVSLADPDDLMKQASERDEELARGKRRGWMHGFPQAPKDVVDAIGFPTTNGSLLLKDYIAKADCFHVDRFKKSGAIIIGKTNVPEFAMGSNTTNRVFGPTGNAFDPSRTAGGSSGGAACAIALRLVPLADGSDFMGSLRNPAGWNNIVSLRPSRGRVPFGPNPEVFYQQFGYDGPMARNVTDLAMLLSVMAGFDPRAPLSLEGDPKQFTRSLRRNFKGTRIAWLGNFNGYHAVEPDVMSVTKGSLKTFEGLGAIVEEVVPDFDMGKLWTAFITLRSWIAYSTFGPIYEDAAARAMMGAPALWEMENGKAVTAAQIWESTLVRSAWTQVLNGLFEKYDYLVAPTASLFPFPVETPWPTQVNGRSMDTYHRYMEMMVYGTMGSNPIATVPGGFSQTGLPIGLQVIGPQTQDFSVLQMAHAYLQASGHERVKSKYLS